MRAHRFGFRRPSKAWYALGPDLQDDGGKIFPKKMSWGGLVKGFDLGFRLWDVNQRRQPSSKAATGQKSP
jgi:hypothetical protein